MRYKILLIVFSLTINSMCSYAQDSNKIKFPESFKLGKQDFLKSVVFLKLKENGYLPGSNIKDNPGVVKDKELMSIFIDDFDTEDINQIYYEIYAGENSKAQEMASVLVVEFKSERLLKKNMLALGSYILPTRFTVDKYVIVIRGDNQHILKGISNFYQNHLGAKFFNPK